MTDQKFRALLTQVEAKWDIIAMLCLLVFCLAFAATFYALFRPDAMAKKVVTFLIALGVGYGLSFVTIHYGLKGEFYKLACHELWQDAGHDEAFSQQECSRRNPIRLSRLPKR